MGVVVLSNYGDAFRRRFQRRQNGNPPSSLRDKDLFGVGRGWASLKGRKGQSNDCPVRSLGSLSFLRLPASCSIWADIRIMPDCFFFPRIQPPSDHSMDDKLIYARPLLLTMCCWSRAIATSFRRKSMSARRLTQTHSAQHSRCSVRPWIRSPKATWPSRWPRKVGIGIIHKNMSIEQQQEEVNKVKRSANGIIRDPVTLTPDVPVSRAQALMEQHNVSGVPITLPNGRLVGILTRRDLRFLEQSDIPISEVMTKENLVTATGEVTLEEAEKILTAKKVEKLLLVDESYMPDWTDHDQRHRHDEAVSAMPAKIGKAGCGRGCGRSL